MEAPVGFVVPELCGGEGAPLPPVFSQVFILKELKVLCFDTLLQVFILKVFTQRLFALLGGGEREGHEERGKAKCEAGTAHCNANTEIGVPGLVVSGWGASLIGYGNTLHGMLSRETY
jgi:hypothetical protein